MSLWFRTVISSAAAVAVASSLVLAASPAQAGTKSLATGSAQDRPVAAAGGTLTAPVTGSFVDAGGGEGVFAGTFNPTSFAASGEQVIATGQLTGTLTDSAGTALGTVTQTISTPLIREPGAQIAPAASCQILDLRLRPIDLDLLGLQVHIDTIHINITAQSGPGNLLGNLLCAVAGLLDGVQFGPLLAALLNAILDLLNGG